MKPLIKPDLVNMPPHYTSGKVECIEALESMGTPAEFQAHCKMSAVAYVFRSGKKDLACKVQDIEKAIWYLKRAKQSTLDEDATSGKAKRVRGEK